MADKKISQLSSATTPLAGTEVLPIVQGGSTVKVSVDDLTAGKAVSASSLTLSGGTANGVLYLDGSKVVTSGTALQYNGVDLAIGGSTGTTPSLNKAVYLQSNTNNQVIGYSLYVNDGAQNRRGSMFLDDSTGVFGWDVTAASGVPYYSWRIANTECTSLTSNLFTVKTASVFNEDGADLDFRVEGDTDANLVFVDASTDKVGIGSSPAAFDKFTVFSAGVGVGINSTSGAGGINFYEGGSGRFSLRTLNGSAGLSFYDTFNTTERARITSGGVLNVGTTATPPNSVDIYANKGISVAGETYREFAKYLALDDNTATTYLTIAIPALANFNDFVNVAGEITYCIYANRETSGRGAVTTYGKAYVAISRYRESAASAAITTAIDSTDKALVSANTAPTITWAISSDAGTTDVAKNVYITLTIDNAASGSIIQGIAGSFRYHTFTPNVGDVTVS